MVNKLKALLVILLLLFAFPVAVSADEDGETVDSDTETEETEESTEEEEETVDEEEAEIISDRDGAHLRLAQLERKLKFHIRGAQAVVTWMQENTDVDTSELEGIIEEMEAILVELEEIDPESDDKEALAEQFLELKSDAIELTKEFRATAGESLDDEQKAALREEIKEAQDELKEKRDDRLDKLEERIKNARQKFNAQKVQKRMLAYGLENNPELIEKIESGEVDIEDVKQRIAQRIRNLTPEEKENIKQRIVDHRKDMKDQRQEKFQDFKERAKEVRANKKERVQQRFDERKDKIRDRIQNRADEFEQRLRKDPAAAERIKNKAERLRDKKPEDITPEDIDGIIDEIDSVDPNLINDVAVEVVQ